MHGPGYLVIWTYPRSWIYILALCLAVLIIVPSSGISEEHPIEKNRKYQKGASYARLIEMANSTSLAISRLRIPLLEVYKSIHHLYPTCTSGLFEVKSTNYDDVVKWKRFPYYWPFARGIHWSLVDSLSKRPVMWSFDVCFDVSLCKLLNKQSRGRWIKTSWWSFDVAVMEKPCRYVLISTSYTDTILVEAVFMNLKALRKNWFVNRLDYLCILSYHSIPYFM